MAKIKQFTGKRKYMDEEYEFIRGIAVVPGMWRKNGKPVLISFQEFLLLQKENK